MNLRVPDLLKSPLLGLTGALALFSGFSIGAAEILPPGHRPVPPGVHALTGGTVVIKPGEMITNGIVVIRDGVIEAAGKDLAVPPDARIWKMDGTIIYPGFIDPYLTIKGAGTTVTQGGGDDDHDNLRAGGGINFFGVAGQEKDQGKPGPSYALSPINPEKRVAETYSPDPKALASLREIGFSAGNIVPEKGIIRGTSAFVLLSDESPNRTILRPDVFQHIAFDQDGAAQDAYPRSLMGVIAATRQALMDAQHYSRAKEVYEKGGSEKGRPEQNLGLEALAPVVAKRMPVVFEPGSVSMVDRASRVAKEFGIDYLLLSSGQEWRWPDLAAATKASFIVPVNFPEIPKFPEEDDWTGISLDQLRAWDWAPENAALLRQKELQVALTTFGLPDRKSFRKNLRLALDRGFTETDAVAALTTIPAKLCGLEKRLGTIEAGKIANLTVVEGSYFIATNKVREIWIDGRVYRVQPGAKDERIARGLEKGDPIQEKSEKEDKAREEKKQEQKREIVSGRVAKPPQEGRGPIASPKAVLIRNATIWTSGPQGILTNTDLLIVDGKIQSLGKEIQAPADSLVINAEGKHVTPGLIDCHSHSMVLGGVNEGTIPSSAMVRIGDVLNADTRNIMQQLAGGLTTANMLHGSANPIGGQNAVVKLKDGAAPEDLKFAGAPSGIKFALGENVKQSNWGERNTTRFPQTRMGVPAFIGNRFTVARAYLAELEKYKTDLAESEKNGKPAPPPVRRDLELEAIGEIIKGERLIHCHSYRQDEILIFLRLMESFSVKVATLQHVLEGYKVADEIAKHGAGASCFSDWWGYKFEVIDAIPYAGTLMHDRGVVVSFNSDSSDLARRLYLEAAKAVKYGNLSEIEALKFVTINPAIQLHIDKKVGSLEPGKDGDFAIWSTSPLDSQTVCLETWIEGKKYFDRSTVPAREESLRKEREQLLEKARKVAGLTKPEEKSKPAVAAFFRAAFEFRYEDRDRHCDENLNEEGF